jgi:hypothetical protein
MKKCKVTLTAPQRPQLSALIATGKAAARKRAHARVLPRADAAPGGPAWADQRAAPAVALGRATVERLRQRFVEQGPEAALGRKPQDHPGRERKPGGRAEAHLIALACSQPPDGRAAWTLQLLADRLAEPKVADSIGDGTVRRTPKKTRASRG